MCIRDRVMGISDRILVMCEGHLNGELRRGQDYDEDTILNLAIGGN